MQAAWILFLIVSWCATRCTADPLPIRSEYLKRSWDVTDGLPQNSVAAILQTRDAYLWLGTFNGLVRFDGVKFTAFTIGNTPELRSDSINRLFEDRSGKLWIGTDGGGLVCYWRNTFTCYPMTGRQGAGVIASIAQDHAGTIWLGTDGGLYQVSGNRCTEVKRPDEKGGFGRVQTIGIDSQGRVWVLSEGSVWTFANGSFSAETRYGRVLALAFDLKGEVWLVSSSFGVFHIGSDEAISTEPWTKRAPSALHFTRDGDIWLTDGGLLTRVRDGKLRDFHLNEKPVGISAVFEDREQNLWVGTDGGGLVRLRERMLTNYSSRDGLPGDDVVALAQDHLKRIWIGTFGHGAGVWVNEKYHRVEGVPSDGQDVLSFANGRNERLWIGTRDGRVLSWQNDCVTTAERIDGEEIRILFEDRDGALWAGTRSRGVRVKDGSRKVEYSTANGLSDNFVTAVVQTPDGAVWVGTKHGLNRILDGKIETFHRQKGLHVACIHTLYVDSAGVLWVGTAGGGLSRFKNGRFSAIASKEGLPNEVVAQIIEDGLGSFWIGSNAGLFRVEGESLRQCADGQVAFLRFQRFDRNDGLLNPECAGSFEPSCLKTPDGRLWFATVGGIVVIDPKTLRQNSVAPPVYLSGVLANGGNCFIQGSASEETLAVDVPPGRSQIQISYSAPSFVTPGAVQFRFRLQGFNDRWVDAGTLRTAYYDSLPPGKYRFEVIACNNDGIWSQSGASLALRVQPFWWQTIGFKVLFSSSLVLALACTIWTFHVARLRRAVAVSERNAELIRSEQLQDVNRQLQSRTQELEEALRNVKTLKGMIPICAHCKKVRTDEGYWQQVESYVQRHSDARFSHGICPECVPGFLADTGEEPPEENKPGA